jgi:hypothetical protein
MADDDANFAIESRSVDVPDSLRIDVKAVLSKVNFRDTPIIALLSLHFLLLIMGIAVRSHPLWRTVVFGICIGIAFVAEKVGGFLSGHWRACGFSADYFDENGVFLLFFFALPPLFTCIILFSHVVGGIGGKIIDRYIESRAPASPAPASTEATKGPEDEKQKRE